MATCLDRLADRGGEVKGTFLAVRHVQLGQARFAGLRAGSARLAP